MEISSMCFVVEVEESGKVKECKRYHRAGFLKLGKFIQIASIWILRDAENSDNA